MGLVRGRFLRDISILVALLASVVSGTRAATTRVGDMEQAGIGAVTARGNTIAAGAILV